MWNSYTPTNKEVFQPSTHETVKSSIIYISKPDNKQRAQTNRLLPDPNNNEEREKSAPRV